MRADRLVRWYYRLVIIITNLYVFAFFILFPFAPARQRRLVLARLRYWWWPGGGRLTHFYFVFLWLGGWVAAGPPSRPNRCPQNERDRPSFFSMDMDIFIFKIFVTGYEKIRHFNHVRLSYEPYFFSKVFLS